MQDIKSNKVFAIFEEINKIPRESGNEKGISDWICSWAKARNLEVAQDEHYNVVIKKPAYGGYENHEPVLLQAHMDMVCEKTAESDHDFEKDPIPLKVEGDWVMSGCGTSLGADNGIGVATAMAILDDDNIKHPRLEVAFTVCEETDFSGAETISSDLFDSKTMINLDHACDNEIIVGSCGGVGIEFKFPVDFVETCGEANPDKDGELKAYKVEISGLVGGHSGEDIHRGNGNAIALMTRFLRKSNLAVADIKAGTNRLAIPRDAAAIVMTRDSVALADYAKNMEAMFRQEYGDNAPELAIDVSEVTSNTLSESDISAKARVLSSDSRKKLLSALTLFPDGITAMNGRFPGFVESSNNLGIVEISDGYVTMTTEVRGMYSSTVDNIAERIGILAELIGAEVRHFARYVPWEFKGESKLREIAMNIYKNSYGKDMHQLALHAGLECGTFAEKRPEMDIISIGPNCMYFHSVNERVSISSTNKFYEFLINILEQL